MDPYKRLIRAARGVTPADAVFSDAEIFNPFTCRWNHGSLAIKDGVILGIGDYEGSREINTEGAYLVPGLIDAHVHIESSLLLPREYAALVARHGTAAVIADPHEIANVAGSAGINYMLAERFGLPVDIRYLVPSCVPSTPADIGGAVIGAEECRRFKGDGGVLGLGEMMDVPGILAGEPGIREKLEIFAIRDGHAPQLSGKDLNAYILSGLQSDHECTHLAEAEEKLNLGMYIYIREGSTEQNIDELASLITPTTAPRCCFATDDCHADLLMEDGHIDRCIRKAIACGVEPELAIRVATLSAAERFGLTGHGALSPGRSADFCVIDDPERFTVRDVFVGGRPLQTFRIAVRQGNSIPFPFRCTVPANESLSVCGKGPARVIGLVPNQIVTDSLLVDCNGAGVPDIPRDILKVVVCNRYGTGSCATGLVHGFGFKKGAIASTVSHDAHNLIATGVKDSDIINAITAVIHMKGGMAAVSGERHAYLPLDCAGLMSSLPYKEVVKRIRALHRMTSTMGGINDPFMYLSFLSLTVVPALRITDRGVFDCAVFRDVPLFTG